MKYDELYISVDVETTGPDTDRHSMYEIGATVVGAPQLRFSTEIALVTDEYVPEALSSCGRTIEELRARNAPHPKTAMHAFADWAERIAARESPVVQPVFVAFAAPFDWTHVDAYFHRYLGRNPFGFTALDVKAFYMGLVRCGWQETRSSRINPLFTSASPHTHRAIDDAVEQAEMFEKMLDFAKALGPLEIPDAK